MVLIGQNILATIAVHHTHHNVAVLAEVAFQFLTSSPFSCSPLQTRNLRMLFPLQTNFGYQSLGLQPYLDTSIIKLNGALLWIDMHRIMLLLSLQHQHKALESWWPKNTAKSHNGPWYYSPPIVHALKYATTHTYPWRLVRSKTDKNILATTYFYKQKDIHNWQRKQLTSRVISSVLQSLEPLNKSLQDLPSCPGNVVVQISKDACKMDIELKQKITSIDKAFWVGFLLMVKKMLWRNSSFAQDKKENY